MWDLPRPRIEPMFPALEGKFLTFRPPGKPQNHPLNKLLFLLHLGWVTVTSSCGPSMAGCRILSGCFWLQVTDPAGTCNTVYAWSAVPLQTTLPSMHNFNFIFIGFPSGSDGKESACNVGDPGSISGSGRPPGGGHGNLLQYSCVENPMDRGAWRATDHRVALSRTWLSD